MNSCIFIKSNHLMDREASNVPVCRALFASQRAILYLYEVVPKF